MRMERRKPPCVSSPCIPAVYQKEYAGICCMEAYSKSTAYSREKSAAGRAAVSDKVFKTS